MTIFLTILHIIVSFILIGVVLLQSGKGAEMGASFGSSGSQSVFGASGGSNVLTKVTTSAAVIFMLTSLLLAYVSGLPSSSSIMSDKSGRPAATAQEKSAQPAADKQPAGQQAPAKENK